MSKFNHNNPVVSVITPTFNSSKFILDTINSVREQTYLNWEMIIVDDCSNDNTVEIIENEVENDDRIKLIKLKKNVGSAVARNTAIEKARGRFIAFLDSDDMWTKDKLDLQVEFMLKNDLAFSFTEYALIDENGKETGKVVKIPEKLNYKELLKNTIIGCLTVMLDKEKIGTIKMPEIRTRQDTALWLKILREGYTAYGLQQNLAKYRKVSNSISSNKFKAMYNTWKVYRNIEKLSFLRSSWCFVNYAYNAYRKRI